MDQPFQPGQLPGGDDGQQQLAGLAQIAALGRKQGDAPVQLGEDGGAQLVGAGADQLDLGAAAAQQDHFVQHDGVGKDQHHPVEHLRFWAGNGLREQDQQVKDGHAGGHRDAEIFLQHQRRDVHAAGRAAHPDHDAQRPADAQPGENGAQEQIVGEDVPGEQPLPHCQGEGG